MIWENIVLAFTSLKANKMRALLTMLGIIIGIAAVITIMTVGDSLLLYVENEMTSLGANNIMISLQERTDDANKFSAVMNSMMSTEIPGEKDLISIEMIKNLYNKYKDEIRAITVYDIMGSGQVTQGREYANVSIAGVSAGYFASEDHDMIGGNIFSVRDLEEGRNVAIVSYIVTDNLFNGDVEKAIGSNIEVSIGDKYYTYTIVGVYDYVVQSMQAIMTSSYDITTEMFIPYKTSVKQTHNNSGVTNFDGYYRNNNDYQVVAFNMQAMVSMVSSMISTITIAISVIAGIALIVGGIGVMNIMLVSITERTREIGTRKALGATNSSIRIQFIVEAIIICLIGGAIGIIFGIIGGRIAAGILGYTTSPSISSMVISLLFSMATGVFFGYYPANKAAKMNPIDALRYE